MRRAMPESFNSGFVQIFSMELHPGIAKGR